MSRRKISRRSMLRGMLGGASVAVALPALDLFLNDHGTAYADGSAFPRRFGVFFWGNGVLPWNWVPGDSDPFAGTVTPRMGSLVGQDAVPLSEQLASLDDLRAKLTIVSGFDVKTGGRFPHNSASCGMLTGSAILAQGEREVWEHPTLDQIVAEAIGDTRFRSLETSAAPGDWSVSYSGANARNPSEDDPFVLYQRLFVDGFRLPGEGGVDPRIALQRSVLDAVMDHSLALRRRLGVNDRRRLDDHFANVRELELRLARLEQEPPSFDSCGRPEAPPTQIPNDERNRPLIAERNALFADLHALALACDQTRVFAHVLGKSVGDVVYPVDGVEVREDGYDVFKGHHDLTHNEAPDAGRPIMWRVNEVTKYIVRCFGDFVRRLDAVPEGDGTLLDHMAVLGTTDASNPRLHSLEDFPILIAGSADGRLVMGQHIRSDGDNASRVGLALLQAIGVPVGEFGYDAGHVSTPAGGLLR
ncbi:MAG: DUF1552 domain-containing protein [Myxococcales bacterium]|nr:DUF1552 domain-containing protein [Myxococcales bacterium]